MYLKQNCFKTESHYAALVSSEPAYYLEAGLKLGASSLPLLSECITGMYHHLTYLLKTTMKLNNLLYLLTTLEIHKIYDIGSHLNKRVKEQTRASKTARRVKVLAILRTHTMERANYHSCSLTYTRTNKQANKQMAFL